MIYHSYTLKALYLSTILSLGSLIKPLYAFSIAPSAPNSLYVGSSVALVYTNLDSSWMNMDVKLAVLNSNNVLDVIAVLATNDHVANSYAGIYKLPANIPAGSNYFFISQISGQSGEGSYAESGPHAVPQSYSPFGANVQSVAAATVLETFPATIAPDIAVAQTTTSASSSATGSTDSVTPTPTPTPSDSQSSNSKSSSASTPTSSDSSSRTHSLDNTPVGQFVSLTKTAIIVIAVVVPVVVISILSIAAYCIIRRRRRRMGNSSGTTPWGTRTTNFVTRDTTTRY